MEASINLAQSSFSSDVNKILISLFDNVPNCANGICNQVTYGGVTGFPTAEAAVIAKNASIVNATKSAILNLAEDNIKFILLRPEDTSFNQRWVNLITGEIILEFDGTEYVIDLYGEKGSPIYGKMYMLTDSSLEIIVTEEIYSEILRIIKQEMREINIEIFFPQYIIDYFAFELVETSNIGSAASSINNETRSVEWIIESLVSGEEAILTYKFKIADMVNEQLLNVTINTNEKIELKYQDLDDEWQFAVLETSPQIRLIERTVPPTPTPTPTLPPTPTPIPTSSPTPTPIPTSNPTPSPTSTSSPIPTPISTSAPLLNTNTNTEKDNTIASESLPKTGRESIMQVIYITEFTILIGFAGVTYKKSRLDLEG